MSVFGPVNYGFGITRVAATEVLTVTVFFLPTLTVRLMVFGTRYSSVIVTVMPKYLTAIRHGRHRRAVPVSLVDDARVNRFVGEREERARGVVGADALAG